MGEPWAELSPAERADAVLLAIDDLPFGDGSAAHVAYAVDRVHLIKRPADKRGRGNGRGDGHRSMSLAVRVVPTIMALRKRGLLGGVSRRDGLSGGADALTDAGKARVAELRAEQSNQRKGI